MHCASQQVHSYTSEAFQESGGGGGGGGGGQGEGLGRDWAGLAHTSLVGGLRLSFISRHCNQQQGPASVHPESLLPVR